MPYSATELIQHFGKEENKHWYAYNDIQNHPNFTAVVNYLTGEVVTLHGIQTTHENHQFSLFVSLLHSPAQPICFTIKRLIEIDDPYPFGAV